MGLGAALGNLGEARVGCALVPLFRTDLAPWAAAQAFLAANPTLHDLVVAGGEVLDVVIQDEYTHDVVARLPGGVDGLLVVFDGT